MTSQYQAPSPLGMIRNSTLFCCWLSMVHLPSSFRGIDQKAVSCAAATEERPKAGTTRKGSNLGNALHRSPAFLAARGIHLPDLEHQGPPIRPQNAQSGFEFQQGNRPQPPKDRDSA